MFIYKRICDEQSAHQHSGIPHDIRETGLPDGIGPAMGGDSRPCAWGRCLDYCLWVMFSEQTTAIVFQEMLRRGSGAVDCRSSSSCVVPLCLFSAAAAFGVGSGEELWTLGRRAAERMCSGLQLRPDEELRMPLCVIVCLACILLCRPSAPGGMRWVTRELLLIRHILSKSLQFGVISV